ncbi:MAG: P-II family nitrogen regulator [Candidatus Zixiibacteriota bacterium]
MKEIKAIIQPFMLSKVINALKELEGLPGVTVSEVKGFGKGRAEDAEHKVVEDFIGYAKKVKLEIVVPDHLVEVVVHTIQTNAHTGNPGDGKIFVYRVDEVVKIRTGETGNQAI